MFTDVVILAGGFGERLWPASRPDFPKQFLSIKDGISFLQEAVLRSLLLQVSGKILIVTRTRLEDEIARQCFKLSETAAQYRQKILDDVLIVAEPIPKHTAAPVILGCRLLKRLEPETAHSVLVLTSDHLIEPAAQFAADAEKAFRAAVGGFFVTFGIKPEYPATGYGYIQTAEALPDAIDAFKIRRFTEKPDAQTAQKYIDSGNCYWNSGMFAFFADFFIDELEQCTPEIANAFRPLATEAPPAFEKIRGVNALHSWPAMNAAYDATPAIAIDRSVAEKTTRAAMVAASFKWYDIGSWDSFAAHTKGEGEAAIVSSENCFIYSDIPVALCGVEGLNVVIKNGKALIMKKGADDAVRSAVQYFKEKKCPPYGADALSSGRQK